MFWPPELRNFEIFYLFWPPEHTIFNVFISAESFSPFGDEWPVWNPPLWN